MSRTGGETGQHCELKRRALLWALAHDFRACALEVRVPRSGFRADVAAAAVPAVREAVPGETVIFECKQSRGDLLRDSADEQATLAHLRAVSARRGELERMIGAHLPNLRRGTSLFPECDDYDFDAIPHRGLRAVRREEACLQAKLYGGTKFDRLRRYRSADRCYLVVSPGVMAPHEAPGGWGVLESSGDGLELRRTPARLECTPGARLALLQAIATAGTRLRLADLEMTWQDVRASRGRLVPE
jgi:hypothetical protein